MLSIIIPTFNERENVEIISARISETLSDMPYEIFFVDDSIDDTPEYLERTAQADKHVKYIHRTVRGNLATAVVLGFKECSGDLITVMDADLQHPPELLLDMMRAMEAEEGVDIVIPSRFIPGGDDGGLKGFRKFASWFARVTGQIILSDLRKTTDPTGGFFMFRKSVIEGVELKPIGWKILIEILVRGHYNKIREVPYAFQIREHGESKFSFKEQINYGLHLLRLLKDSPKDRRFILFLLVGGLGFIIDIVGYYLLLNFVFTGDTISAAGLSLSAPAVCAAISAVISMLCNFVLNSVLTWGDRKQGNRAVGLIKYTIVSLIGIMIQAGTVFGLFNVLGIDKYIAKIIGVILGSIWNYIVNNKWTFKDQE